MHYNIFKLFKSFSSLEKFVYLYNYSEHYIYIYALALIFFIISSAIIKILFNEINMHCFNVFPFIFFAVSNEYITQ